MVIDEIFDDVEWDCIRATVYCKVGKNGNTVYEADLKCLLPNQTSYKDAFSTKIAFKKRRREHLANCRRLDDELIHAGITDEVGIHESLTCVCEDSIVAGQKRNTNWDRKYMRPGVGRMTLKKGATNSKGPMYAGVVGVYDPGTKMLSVSIGRQTFTAEMYGDDLTENQKAASIIAHGFLKHRPIKYTTTQRDEDAVRNKLREAIASSKGARLL